MKKNFFFPARVDEIARYATQVVAALGKGYEGTLVHAAISEALLNGIVYGVLGITAERGERDPLAFLDIIRAAETKVGPYTGLWLDVELDPASPEEAQVCIRDPGAGFNWRALQPVLFSDPPPTLPEQATCGRGLLTMRAGSRYVSWNEKGNEVTLRIRQDQHSTNHVAALPFAPTVMHHEVDIIEDHNSGGAFPMSLAPPSSKRKGARILVVDDEDYSRLLLQMVLRSQGYVVDVAEDGPSALRKMVTFKPEIAVMDVQMPGMTGVEVVQHMRELCLLEETSVLLLTGGGNDDNFRSLAIEAGASDFLQKPISKRELIARVRRNLSMRKNLSRLTGERDELQSSVVSAARLMEALLPKPHMVCATATIATLVAPSRLVGGDVVDFVRISPSSWAVLLIDVAGHGVAAALTAVAARAVLRDRLDAGQSLGNALTALNSRLYEDWERTSQHAAVAALLVDEAQGTMEIANAGCPPIALWTRAGDLHLVRSNASPAGLLHDMVFGTTFLPIAMVAQVAVVSDGITEGFATSSDTLRALEGVGAWDKVTNKAVFSRSQMQSAIKQLGDERDDASIIWVQFRC